MVNPKSGVNAMQSPRQVREKVWVYNSYGIRGLILYKYIALEGCEPRTSLAWPGGPLSLELICSWRLELGLSDIGTGYVHTSTH